MNIRIDSQSVRLRLSQKEAVLLLEQGQIEESVAFLPTQKFLMIVRVIDSIHQKENAPCSLEWSASAVTVNLTEQALRPLREQKQNKDNGIKFNQHALLVVVEIDLWNRS